MPADPRSGCAYRQEYYEGEAEDNGEVLSTDEHGRGPVRPLRRRLLTKDTITIEPDVLEYKLYAARSARSWCSVSRAAGRREELVDVENVSKVEEEKAGTSPLGSGRRKRANDEPSGTGDL